MRTASTPTALWVPKTRLGTLTCGFVQVAVIV